MLRIPPLVSRRWCPRFSRIGTVCPIWIVARPAYTRHFQVSALKRTEHTPLPTAHSNERQWLDYLHRISHSASTSPKLLTELAIKTPEAGIFDAPNRMERAYALIFQLFLYLSRPQPGSTSSEHWLQSFETLPSFDGDDLHLARLCAIHIVKIIVWEFEGIKPDDPQRAKYPDVFEDARALALLCETYVGDHENVPPNWSAFWSEAQTTLLALGMDLGDAGYAIQAPPDPEETPGADPSAQGLTRAQGFKGVDLTGKAGPPVSGAPNILETAQPGGPLPDRIEMEFKRDDKESPDRPEYWLKNHKGDGFF